VLGIAGLYFRFVYFCICLFVCFIFFLLSRESDGGAIFWTNPHPRRSCPFSRFPVASLTSFHFICCLFEATKPEIIIVKRLIRGHNNVCAEGGSWLAKTGATLSIIPVPSSRAPTIAKIRHTRYSFWRRNLSHNYSHSCEIPSVSSEKLVLSRLIRCELSRLRC